MVITIWLFIFITIIIFFIMIVNKKFDQKKFIQEVTPYFAFFKEKDYEFLLKLKYGDEIDSTKMYNKRLKTALIVFVVAFVVIFIANFGYIYLLLSFIAGFIAFKLDYINLSSFRKSHMHKIDLLLPYYLKSLEILAQHYTIPVALRKSIDSAPDVFKKGLEHLCDQIEAGDSSVEPYMEFAREYPVRDSMRMMRLLYRLGIGSQENKQEQLLMFSRTISSLQNKAREQKYKERLEAMEKRTLVMLICTGGGVMGVMMIAMMGMMTAY
ncbi:MAG: hypothetical protein J6D28_03400 [Bacilli bacterium]|nr:hypothetical protein [Bacilli bacterium]